jgi:hypothetical protein
MSQQDVANFLREIDRERGRLKAMLRSRDSKVLAMRPANDDWSIVDNVRHLLFAEQLHLGRFLPDGFEWSSLGMTGMTAKKFADVGKTPTKDVEKVFREWDVLHSSIRKAIKSAGGDIERALWRNHRHLVIHIRIIETLLRKSGA